MEKNLNLFLSVLRFDFRKILKEWCNETQKELDFIHEVRIIPVPYPRPPSS